MRLSATASSAFAAARLALVLLLMGVATACSADNRAVFHTRKGDFPFSIEVADTEASRERGLMFRTSLAPDAGMLFDYHQEQQASFWMQNTLIPLDMIFIRPNGTIARVAANTVPLSEAPVGVEEPVTAVLELRGGRAAELGIREGDRVSWSD